MRGYGFWPLARPLPKQLDAVVPILWSSVHRIPDRLSQTLVQRVKLPHASGKSLFSRPKTIGETVELVELVMSQHACCGLHEVWQCMDIRSQIAAQARRIVLANVAGNLNRAFIGGNAKAGGSKQE